MTVIRVGPISEVLPRSRVPRPPRRAFERTVILDVGPILGSVDKQARAFFRLRRPFARDREVGFQLGEIKAANFRPGLYRYRLEILVDPMDVSKGATVIKTGEIVPSSVPVTVTFNDIMVVEGTFALTTKDVVIQVFDQIDVEVRPVFPPDEILLDEG